MHTEQPVIRGVNPPNSGTASGIDRPSLRPLLTAGIVLGLGQGGFFDGIVLHQLLQWHHMFSSVETDMTVAGLELNTIGDGLFHLLDWLLSLAGIFLLWRSATQRAVLWSGRALVGSMLMGFGIFNLVEGLIDHHLLGIHHVRSGLYQTAWDLGFLALGTLLLIVGWLMVQSVRSRYGNNG